MVSFQQGPCSLADVLSGQAVFAHQHRSGREGAEMVEGQSRGRVRRRSNATPAQPLLPQRAALGRMGETQRAAIFLRATPASAVSKVETPAPSQCRLSQKMPSVAARRFQRCAAYLESPSSRLRAGLGTATLPLRISWRFTSWPYMAWSPLLSACTTAPSKLSPAKAPLLRE